MRWTFKKETRGVALTDGKMFKKGDAIPVTVYDLYTDSRGGASKTVEVYYYGNAPKGADSEPTMRPPKEQQLLKGRTFELAKETSTGVSSTPSESGGTMEELTNNKTVMWLGLIVVGYFAYKYYYKK
jgi:hypothetical protein